MLCSFVVVFLHYYVIMLRYMVCGKYINSTFGVWGILFLCVTCWRVGLTIKFEFDFEGAADRTAYRKNITAQCLC